MSLSLLRWSFGRGITTQHLLYQTLITPTLMLSHMRIVLLSNEAYNELVSRRIGRQSLSTTLLNNLSEAEGGWDVEKLTRDLDEIIRISKPIPHEEVFADIEKSND